jgi:hypothetical protein
MRRSSLPEYVCFTPRCGQHAVAQLQHLAHVHRARRVPLHHNSDFNNDFTCSECEPFDVGMAMVAEEARCRLHDSEFTGGPGASLQGLLEVTPNPCGLDGAK